MSKNQNNLGLVICTRNRAHYLGNLLQSISQSKIKPRQIVLVSSGEDIKKMVSPYYELINIKHIHTEKIGQSNQKVIAISSLDSDIDWVFFLDDDLLLLPDTIDFVLEKINQLNGNNVAGIGTQIMPLGTPYTPNKSDETNKSKKKLGKILKSGRALPYQSPIETNTEWLNGASIWKRDVLQKYQLPLLDSKYAAYEDVIFSTEVSKSYELIYDPQIKIREQICHNKLQPNLSAFKFINLWTGYFVCIDSRTKLSSFKILTILRLLKFSNQKLNVRHAQLTDLLKAFKLAYLLIALPNDKVKSKEIILNLIREESSFNS
jgi:glycosyltransferase involved in cell wall biosynthesis